MQESWPRERAHAWMQGRSWRVGCNFVPSTASNPLEMWQEASFDLETLERELGFAAELGFTSLRVFLHDLLWVHERAGFLERMERFLAAAAERGIGVLPVLFDGVWDPHPRPGPQREPRPRVHNSRWVQSPGAEILSDPSRHDALAHYVKGVIDHFRADPRIDGWDLFNEPDNPNFAYAKQEIADKQERALALLKKTVTWAREVAPSQPLTVGVWRGSWSEREALSEINRFSLAASDIVSFHHYGELAAFRHRVAGLRHTGRPLLCTEFMARALGSGFEPQLTFMRDEAVGAYCWGLVAGRSQTQFPWDSWLNPQPEDPAPWHHDILRPDGTPYDESEVAFVRTVTRRSSP